MEKKGTKIEIELVRTDGGFQAASLHAVDVCFDEGFVIQNKPCPAVKIIRSTKGILEPYFIVGAHNPAGVTSIIKKSIEDQSKVYLPYTIFDKTIVSWQEAQTLMRQTGLGRITLLELMRNAPKKTFLSVLGNSKAFPPGAAHVFARSLPTFEKPELVSRHQYFKYLLQ